MDLTLELGLKNSALPPAPSKTWVLYCSYCPIPGQPDPLLSTTLGLLLHLLSWLVAGLLAVHCQTSHITTTTLISPLHDTLGESYSLTY
jgi:hypothetical protein